MANLVHQDLAGHDQSFLVGKQNPLGGPYGGKRRLQAGRTDNSRHHHIHIAGGDRFGQRVGAALHAGRRAAGTECVAGQRRRLGVHQHHRLCLKLPRLLHDRFPAAVGGQHRHPEPLRMQGNHAERAAPDAPGGAENGESERRAHAITPEPNSPSADKGAAAVTLSMRSSIPPCPGSSMPLSFSPAERLNMLSVRSPMMEKMPTAQPNITAHADGSPKWAAPHQATSATSSSPPSAPSRVLPGLTRGASFRRPRLRPAKYAPTSAAITSSNSQSTSTGPRAKPWVATCSLVSAMKAGTNTGTPQASTSVA